MNGNLAAKKAGRICPAGAAPPFFIAPPSALRLRPADISGLSARLTRLLAEATDSAQKDLLNREIREVSAFTLTGEVTERQFYLICGILWVGAADGGE